MLCDKCGGNKGFCECETMDGFSLGDEVKFKTGRPGRIYTITKSIKIGKGKTNYFILDGCSNGDCIGHRACNLIKMTEQ
jgi:hypothetical protein